MATFQVDGPLPVVELRLDLVGDGLPAPTIVRGEDLRAVAALLFTPARAGTWSLHLYAVDACGREGSTGLSRPVVVPLPSPLRAGPPRPW